MPTLTLRSYGYPPEPDQARPWMHGEAEENWRATRRVNYIRFPSMERQSHESKGQWNTLTSRPQLQFDVTSHLTTVDVTVVD
jgi:hypothetical protein